MKPPTVYRKLLTNYGPQFWWPVTDEGELVPTYKRRAELTESQKFEICIGAILAQNTDWGNAMKALENLNRAKMLSCEKLAGARQAVIASLIKPSGYFNQKAKRLILFARHLKKNYGCSTAKMFAKPMQELRQQLLSLHGIGNETADDIVLYAAEKPGFVVDAYTRRFVERFYGKKGFGYVEAKSFFESRLPKDAALFNEFHALLVGFGKRSCRKKPACKECFLRGHCLFFKNAIQ